MKILVVCTANRCRSPIGEVLLRKALPDTEFEVSSAGFMSGGSPAESGVIEALDQVGLDARGHRSRALTPYLVDETDLILTMERAHVRDLAVNFGAFGKTFTVKEFVRRSTDVPRKEGEAMSDWLSRLHVGRKASELVGANSDDEVADPIGKPVAAFVATRDELDSLVGKVAAVLIR